MFVAKGQNFTKLWKWKKKKNCEKSKNKGEKSEKIADLGSYHNQPSAEGLA